MNGPIEQTIRKFNPGTFQPDEEVIRQFVVRKCELDIVLEILRGNIDSPSCEHVLLVAPRGRGKTTLLARVASELRTDTELSGRLFPIRFMEESQEIFNLADFWLETLFYLARESTQRDPELSRELQDTHAGLAGEWRGENLEERARAAVLEAADRIGMKLVLMVENLQALCECVDDDFGWKLRGALQSEPQIMLLATATSRFKGLDDAREPFFELFRVLRLEPLDTEQCRSLWQMVTRDAVTGREIRPLQILTGGNPRLLIIIADFARHRSLRELMEDLVSLIDDHTEYFRAHLEGFAKTERRIYLSVIDLWQPSTTGEIAARARMDVRAASALLGRLVERGAVIVEGSGRKRMYAASERLYSIYYKLRRERDEAAVVRNLIHFMAVFYSADELAEISGNLRSEAAKWPAIREGLRWAAAEDPEIGRFFLGMEQPNIDGASRRTTPINDRSARQLLHRIATALRQGEFQKTIEIIDQFTRHQSANPHQVPEPLIPAVLLVKGIAYSELGTIEAEIATYDDVVDRFGDCDVPDIQATVIRALSNKGHRQLRLGETDAAIATYDEMVGRFGDSGVPEVRVVVARAMANVGFARWQLGEIGAAIATYDAMVDRFGDNDVPEMQVMVAEAMAASGVAQWKLGEPQAAIGTYDKLLERFETSDQPEVQEQIAKALAHKGYLQGQLGEHKAALATYDWVVEHFGVDDVPEVQVQVATALICKGILLAQIGQTTVAIAAFDQVNEHFGDSDICEIQYRVALAMTKKSVALLVFGNPRAAIIACDEVMEHVRGNDAPPFQGIVATALLNKGLALAQLGETVTAIATWDAVATRFGNSGAPELQKHVAMALNCKGTLQLQSGDLQEAIATCDELGQRASALTDNEKVEFEWRAIWLRTEALLLQEKFPAAMDTFRIAYSAFIPGNETMMHDMLVRVPGLITAGASERDIVEILCSDEEKSSALVPLIVALRQRTGETVRTPAEVQQVAADIRKIIKAKTGRRNLAPFDASST